MSKKDKWVRELAREYGIEDERLDYDSKSGYITLDGKNTVKPDYVTEGKSYVSDTSALEKIFKEATGKVAVADYAASKPNPIKLSWDEDEGVSLQGKKVAASTISGNKAYAEKSAIDEILSGKSQSDIAEEAYDKYGEAIEKLLKEAGEKEFSYDPEKDEAYLAYKKQYGEAGEKAISDLLAKYSEATGGLPNSMAVTQAGSAAAEYNKALTDKIPQLIEAAYKRFLDESDQNLKTADAYNDALSAYINAFGGALSKDNDEIRKNNQYVDERYEKAAEKERKEAELLEKKEAAEKESAMAEAKLDYEKMLDAEKLSDTRKKEIRTAIENAYSFIEKAFVSEDTGVNLNGVKMYLESLKDVLPEEIRAAILETYSAKG